MCLGMGRVIHHNNITVDDYNNLTPFRPATPPSSSKLCIAAPFIFRYNNVKITSNNGDPSVHVLAVSEDMVLKQNKRAAILGEVSKEKQKLKVLDRAKEKFLNHSVLPTYFQVSPEHDGEEELGEKEQIMLFETSKK